jgi:hypothetical protein
MSLLVAVRNLTGVDVLHFAKLHSLQSLIFLKDIGLQRANI